MVENYDIMFKILHKLNPLKPIRDPQTSDIMFFFANNIFLHVCFCLYVFILTVHKAPSPQGAYSHMKRFIVLYTSFNTIYIYTFIQDQS